MSTCRQSIVYLIHEKGINLTVHTTVHLKHLLSAWRTCMPMTWFQTCHSFERINIGCRLQVEQLIVNQSNFGTLFYHCDCDSVRNKCFSESSIFGTSLQYVIVNSRRLYDLYVSHQFETNVHTKHCELYTCFHPNFCALFRVHTSRCDYCMALWYRSNDNHE